jgi:hypothetical protein
LCPVDIQFLNLLHQHNIPYIYFVTPLSESKNLFIFYIPKLLYNSILLPILNNCAVHCNKQCVICIMKCNTYFILAKEHHYENDSLDYLISTCNYYTLKLYLQRNPYEFKSCFFFVQNNIVTEYPFKFLKHILQQLASTNKFYSI